MPIPAGFRCNQWGWFWKESDNSGPYFLDRDGNMMPVGMRKQMFTDSDGNFARLRVDPGQTGFFARRMFRVVHEFTVVSGQSTWLRFTAPLNVIIHGRDITVLTGNLRFALGTGGTPSGVWTPKAIFPVNAMTESPAYTGVVIADQGGSNIGMIERDLVLLETGNNNQAASVNLGVGEVGLAANTYFTEFRNTGNSTLRGLYRVFWEERP